MLPKTSRGARPGRRRQAGQVLIILFATLFLGGSAAVTVGLLATGRSLDDLRKATHKVVGGSGTRASVDALYDRWEHQGDKHFERRAKREGEILDLIERHDASRAEFDALFEKLDREEAEAWSQLVQILMGLRTEIGPQGWNRVFKAPKSPAAP